MNHQYAADNKAVRTKLHRQLSILNNAIIVIPHAINSILLCHDIYSKVQQ